VTPLIAPSLLAANFLNLAADIDMVNRSEADFFHIDVMDGHFVPNITFGFFIIKQIKSLARKPLDVHLMISEPERYLQDFCDAGADWLSVHYETCPHLHSTVNRIRQLGMKPGVVLNPHTRVDLLEDILPEVDMVLIMSVNPGFGGQSFIEHTYARIERLCELREKTGADFHIQVDGGVDIHNAGKLVKAGASVLVAGTTVFKSSAPIDTIARLKSTGV
jgi:ribulose-phosphate 3-epimerase